KAFVVLTMIALLGYGVKAADTLGVLSWPMWMLLGAALLGTAASAWYILTGRTTIDAHGIRQDWITQKSFEWGQIKRVRLLRLPLSSRLLISTGLGPYKAIQAGSPELDAAFKDIAAHYREQLEAAYRGGRTGL
ncbi:MAG: hypothetical protein VW339_00610, partial [Quisquiliibacterium sp.]